MTAGQQRALQELLRMQAAEPDGLAVVGEPRMASGSLVAKFSIRLGPIETAEGGLDLHEREEFVLHVPPDFPFDRPWLKVEHKRFAGFPHVIWAKSICLYRNSGDWNPRDGLYGFFDKLRLWLGKAAINDMDPADVPLEPPHHVTAFSQVPFVVRTDAPVPPGQAWTGLAELVRHPNRIELDGWRDLFDEWPKGKAAAFAIMLAEPLPMEFPQKGRDFFAELEKQGVDRNRVMHLLACACLLTEPGEPIHLVLGLPMRRAADGTLRLHIAVWTTSPVFAKSLRLTLEKDEDGPSLQEIRKELADAIYEILADDDIAWCQILEDRPEIVVRRDQSSAASWFLGKRVLLLGCGALGSWIGEIAARAGAVSIDVVDNAIVKPGLLTRQNYCLEDIGNDKATALASRLKSVSATTQCQPFVREAHTFVVEDPARLQTYDIVIDCTASSIFQMKLERDWSRFKQRTPPMISIGIDGRAQSCLTVTIPANAVGGVWDAYIQLKHRLCIADTSRGIVEAFYSDRAGKDLLHPEPGCSDPTFRGSTADVAGLAAMALNLAIPQVSSDGRPFGIAFSSPLAGTARIAADVIELSNLSEVMAGSYRVRVASNVHREARAWVLQNNRLRSVTDETGGLLWGLWDDAIEVIWLFDASGPPSDSRHDPGSFVCGVDGAGEEHRRRMALTRDVCGFVGMWHTHPDMPSEQSVTDIGGMTRLVAGVGQNQRRSLMVIYGRASGRPTAGFYVYDSRARDGKSESIAVLSGHITLEAAVV